MTTNEHATGVYRSGVAARLSGVPVDTLRIWERRYAVVGPRLSAGRQRLYSKADIRRLTMIKQLVDQGHPIGTIAALPTDELSSMQAAMWSAQPRPGPAAPGHSSRIKVALIGPLLTGAHYVKAFSGERLDVIGHSADPAQASVALKDVGADVAIIELATVSEANVGHIESIKAACGAAKAIVLYRFAPSAIVRRMRAAGHAMARWTSDATELEAICQSFLRQADFDTGDLLRLLEAARSRPPRFDEPTLAGLSGASRTIECECPRHLVDLVMSLSGFERYSAQCASGSDADALLHLDLQRAAALARSIMERALERVAIAEGIALPAAAADR